MPTPSSADNGTLIIQPNYMKLSITMIGLVVFVYALRAGQAVIVPILFALLLAMLLDPVVERMVKWRIPRWIGISVSILFAMLFMAGIGYFIATQAAHFSEAMPDLEKKWNALGKDMQRWAQGAFNMKRQEVAEAVEKVKTESMEKGGTLVGQTLTTVGTLFAFFFLLPVFTFLILLYKHLLLGFIARLFKPERHPQVRTTLKKLRGVVGSYLMGLILEAGIVATLNWLGLMAIGVQYALLLAVISAVLNLIPYIGMMIATALPMLIALATVEPSAAIWVLVLYSAVQFVDNNIIVPRIVGARVQLNALVSLVAVMVGGAIWGVPGMFLSLPIAAMLKVIFDHSDGLQPFGYLLGDDQPKSPHGIFTSRSKAAIRPPVQPG